VNRDNAPVGLPIFGLVLVAAAAITWFVATLWRGVAWGWGAAAGGAAAAADFYFLAAFGVAWFNAAANGKRVVARGVAALAAKVVLPPAALAGAAVSGWFAPAALAMGALAVAMAAPLAFAAALSRRAKRAAPVNG